MNVKSEPPAATHVKSSIHSGFQALAIILGVKKIAADPVQLMHEYAPDNVVDTLCLVRAARGMEVRARAAKIKPSRLPKQVFPVIAELQDGEYVILGRATKDQVILQRTSGPIEQLTKDEFVKIWSGTILSITRRATLASEDRRFDLTWFLPSIAKYRSLFGEVLLASFFLQLFALATPLFFQVIIDKVLVHRGLSTLDVLAFGMIAIAVFEILLGGLRTFIFSHTTSRVDVELGSRLFRHVTELPLTYFGSRPVGQVVARVRELENIRDFLTGSALTVLIDSFFTFVFFGVMYFYSPLLFWIVAGSVPFYIVLSIAITPGLRKRIEEKFQRGAINQSFLTESVTGVETLKSMAIEPQMRHRWETQLAAYVKAGYNAIIFSTIGSKGVELISRVTMVLVLWFGAQMVISGELSVGELIAFNMLANRVSGPIIRLAQLWQDFQQMKISMDRLGDILNCPTEVSNKTDRQNLPNLTGQISFDRASFRYELDRPEAIRDFSLEIESGEVVGVVGRSGSGKSTLTKLIQRLYIPERGRVMVDGIDLAMVDPSWLRRQIGVVLQDNVLFKGSVRDNIALADPAMPIEQVVEAAQNAGAHDFILELSHGYDTEIEERGSNLSGGQRQRIAIARALAGDPSILIFDEATSALDYESERIIQLNMQRICAGRTVIIVAHRLSTIRDADRIVVMDGGSIVEQGPHTDLIDKRGAYARLHEQQT